MGVGNATLSLANNLLNGASTVTIAMVNATEGITDLVAKVTSESGSAVKLWRSGFDLLNVQAQYEAQALRVPSLEAVRRWLNTSGVHSLPASAQELVLAAAGLVFNNSASSWEGERYNFNLKRGEFAHLEVRAAAEGRDALISYRVANTHFGIQWSNPLWEVMSFDIGVVAEEVEERLRQALRLRAKVGRDVYQQR